MAKILVVDDTIEVREIIKIALSSRGHTIVTAKDGAEALAMIPKEKPALVVMDCNMPVMDGWQACQAIRANPATRELPVLMCTAQNKMSDVEKCLQSGATDYIAKPIDLARLGHKVERGLQGFKLPPS